ncbi:hypothetical protein SAMN02745163_02883 [Clostridium cavendishii DSM 21758]|uniref:Nitroreductase domain-containing protein n=1 Tax=Clostridium cavendishii DSM 21758 TaxID=1121302 RepID=A0A1M6NET1_9CLOT|nr:nitroreductase family protein [Clostridium cavendishii]SHJ94086.1 hypothetical protein SAMN02745163_02883 [Clostridium cavendishii DSM 21758]
MTKDFYTAVKERRSIYGISNETTISNERIEEVIADAVKYTPTAFNSQSGRVVVLFGDNHKELWNITKEGLRKIVPEDKFAPTEERVNSFYNGYGTVLFFEDTSVVESLQQQFALYKDNFPNWSQQATGILQYVVWTSLEVEGLGVSLQHYNPLIDEEVSKKWNIPSNWKFIAQMPFGKPTAAPKDKEFVPVNNRMKVFK